MKEQASRTTTQGIVGLCYDLADRHVRKYPNNGWRYVLAIAVTLFGSALWNASPIAACTVSGNNLASFGQVAIYSGNCSVTEDSRIVFKGGNLGIGTGSPTGKIDARGSFSNTDGDVLDLTPTLNATTNGEYFLNGVLVNTQSQIASGVQNTGQDVGINVAAERTQGFDAGFLSALVGIGVTYGHDTSAAPTTDNAIGLDILPFHSGGTITNSYDLWLEPPRTTGGTITASFRRIRRPRTSSPGRWASG